jgi:hypothetical protein
MLKLDKMNLYLVNIVHDIVRDFFSGKPEFGKIMCCSAMHKSLVAGFHIAVMFMDPVTNEYTLQLVFTVENKSEKILMGKTYCKSSTEINKYDFKVRNMSEL